MTSAKPADSNLEMKANISTVDEHLSTTRLVTKQDGSQVPFSEQTLRTYLEEHLQGLNTEYISVDIIVGKVNSGLYNGKSFVHSKPPVGLAQTWPLHYLRD